MKIMLFGYGKMGHMLEDCISGQKAMSLVKTIDGTDFNSLKFLGKIADVAIDFSSPSTLPAIAEYVERTKTPLVSGTTGYSAQELLTLKKLGGSAPVLFSANYSLGIAVLSKALRIVSESLSHFDIELVETHHNQKADAPSGTARRLIDAIDPEGTRELVYGREGLSAKRNSGEIGVHAIRGGTVAGEHSVKFFGNDEILELTHKASSRKIFAEGALSAAVKLASKSCGYYTLEELLFGKEN